MTDKQEIKIHCQGADLLPIDSIIEFQGNLKKITRNNLNKLKSRILQEGFIAPIFIWQHEGDNFILDGHQRLTALISLRVEGYDIPLLPVAYIHAENVDDAKRKLLSITGQYGEFDMEVLNEWLEMCDDEMKQSLRLVNEELEIALNQEAEETIGDDEVNEEVEPVTKLGDLWELGSHRVLCGDSTDKETVEKLMDGKKADMVFTDPPYGVDYEGINNDNRDGLSELLNKVFENYFNSSKSGASIYCFHSDRCADIFHVEFRKHFHFSSMIIWNKNSLTMSQTDYQSKHEPCMYGWMNNGTHSWFSDRKQTSVWDVEKQRVDGHSTPKPIKIIQNAINNSSKGEDIVSDFFLGSGSTLIACEKTSRVCCGIELDTKYCDVIVNRYKTWCEKNNRIPIIKLNGEVYKWVTQ